MLKRRDHLGQACRAGSGLQVSEVGFRRTEQRGLVGIASTADHTTERVRFDRIAEQGACAVRLDVVDRRRNDAGISVGPAQYIGLGVGVRREQTIGTAVAIGRRTLDHAENTVVVTFRVAEPLEHDHAGSLGANHPIGIRGESLDLSVCRNRTVLVETERDHRHQQHVDAAGQRNVRIAAAQGPYRLMNRDQGGRARGVHRDRGATEVVEIGHPIGDDARRATRDRVCLGRYRQIRILVAEPHSRDQLEIAG